MQGIRRESRDIRNADVPVGVYKGCTKVVLNGTHSEGSPKVFKVCLLCGRNRGLLCRSKRTAVSVNTNK